MEHLKELEQKFNTLALKLKDELSSVRTNRPTPKLVDSIKAEYAGQFLAVNQLGSISVEPPRSIIVTPWSTDSAPSIVKAIEAANIGVSAAQQGNVVRITLPELTEERRQELIKLVRKMAEETRIRMRIDRDEVNKIINQEADKNEKFRAKEALQKLVDKFNQEVDEVVDTKIQEISA
ncbi:MAG: ribosome-recycling factor [bacterium]|nr:ribosome-recycling factor [bacterium]